MTRIKRLAKEGGWIVAGQIASVLGALVLVRVLTEYLDPAQYGQLALGLTVAGLINQVVMGGVTNGIGRFYSIAAEKQDLVGYLHATRRLMLYATLVVVVISLLVITGLLWLGYPQWIALAAVALMFSVLSAYNGTLSGIQNAARQRAVVAFHGGLDAWLKIGLAMGVMLWLGSSSTAVVWGYALSALVVTGSQFYFLRRLTNRQGHNNAPADGNWGKQIWAVSWPFSTWGSFTWAQQVSDRWAMEAFASTAEVGEYVVLFQLGYTPISLATGLMVSFIAPILFQRSGDATDAGRNAAVHGLTWRITGTALFITVLGFVVTMALHERLFWFFVAAPYRGLSHWLPWVVLAGGLFAAGQLLSLKLMADMQPKKIIVVKIVTALIGVIFNVLGAAYYGLAGVIAGLVAFSVVYLAWMAWMTAWMPSSQASPSLKRL